MFGGPFPAPKIARVPRPAPDRRPAQTRRPGGGGPVRPAQAEPEGGGRAPPAADDPAVPRVRVADRPARRRAGAGGQAGPPPEGERPLVAEPAGDVPLLANRRGLRLPGRLRTGRPPADGGDGRGGVLRVPVPPGRTRRGRQVSHGDVVIAAAGDPAAGAGVGHGVQPGAGGGRRVRGDLGHGRHRDPVLRQQLLEDRPADPPEERPHAAAVRGGQRVLQRAGRRPRRGLGPVAAVAGPARRPGRPAESHLLRVQQRLEPVRTVPGVPAGQRGCRTGRSCCGTSAWTRRSSWPAGTGTSW